MDMIGRIKRLHSRGKKSGREISRMTGLSRNTVASVAEMLEHERTELMPMPVPFDGYVEKSARVSSTCLVAVARNRYSVPCELVGQMVSTRLYPGSVVAVVAHDAVVARHERLGAEGQTRYDWQHYIPLLQRKPGALRNGAPFADLPEPLQQLRRRCCATRAVSA